METRTGIEPVSTGVAVPRIRHSATSPWKSVVAGRFGRMCSTATEGGETGIRTQAPGWTIAFEATAFDRSAISPEINALAVIDSNDVLPPCNRRCLRHMGQVCSQYTTSRARPTGPAPPGCSELGRDGRDRTCESRGQNPLPYHLATSLNRNYSFVTTRDPGL